MITIQNVSKGDKYENLSPEEYLNMIRPYLRDLINEHIPTMELNNDSNNDNNNYDDDNYNFADDDEYRKLEALEHYLKSLIEIITNQ